MIGFFFANRHSKDFNIVAMVDASRGLLPAKRRNDYEISGRDGTVDFGNETYDTRPIPVEICFISDNTRNLQTLAHDIAHWLSGKGMLIFDDNPGKALDAVVYEAVDTDQIIRTKQATVIFECQPDYKTINFLQSINPGITSGHTVEISSNGTRPTPGIIILRNTGNVGIQNVTITRRALHR